MASKIFDPGSSETPKRPEGFPRPKGDPKPWPFRAGETIVDTVTTAVVKEHSEPTFKKKR